MMQSDNFFNINFKSHFKMSKLVYIIYYSLLYFTMCWAKQKAVVHAGEIYHPEEGDDKATKSFLKYFWVNK